MNDERLKSNIIKILIICSCAFLLLIGYLSYFEIKYGEKLVTDPSNKRNIDRESEVLRGSIYDRSMGLIADSVRQQDKTQKRVYSKDFAMPYAPIIGYYSSKYGVSGLEKNYTKELLNDNILNPFKLIRDVMTRADRKGNSLVLTIDSKLQKAAYDALGNNRGAIVAMDPRTGEILCMVSKPVFNPSAIDNDWGNLLKQNEEGPFLNRAIQPGLYPPGSTFKIIVASEAIEKIKDIDSRVFQCNGNLKIGNYTLSDYGDESHGKISLHDAFVESCNITFGQVGMELGADRLKAGAEDFGFNKPLNFDLQTSMSQFPTIDKTRKDSLAQSSIGQYDVRVTPLEMLLAASAIANNGIIMKPFLVKSIIDTYGWTVSSTQSQILYQPIKKETANEVKSMMVDVVKKGTGKNAKIDGIEVAGKTGTAEVGENRPPHSWFVAFAPAGNPEIAISIIAENGEIGGGKAAAISKEIFKTYFNK